MNDARGFTLIELLVVAVLGSLLLVATYNVLITNQRTYTVQSAQIQGQQTVRAGMDLLFSELREISAQGGDLLSMDDEAVEVRVMRSAAILCDTATTGVGPLGDIDYTFINLGDTLVDGDSIFVYAEHSPGTTSDDVWIVAEVSLDDTTTCGSRSAQVVDLDGPSSGTILFDTDTPTVGSIARTYTIYEYGLDSIDGGWYLTRTPQGGSPVQLVGPVMRPASGGTPGGVSFEYMDSDGNVTAVGTEVRQIMVTLRTRSQVRNPAGDLVTDSLKARIYTRN